MKKATNYCGTGILCNPLYKGEYIRSSNFIIADSRRYKCSTHTNGGKHACENHLAVNRKLAEKLPLESVTEKVLTAEFLAECRKQVARLVKEKKVERAKADPRKKYQQRLAKLEQHEANVVEAIVRSGINDALQKRLAEISADKKDRQGQLAATPAKLDTLPDIIPRELERIRDKVLNLDSLLNRKTKPVQIAKARTALRKLFSEMRLIPNCDKGYLEAHMAINKKALGLVLTGYSASMVNVVVGARFDQMPYLFTCRLALVA